VGRAQVFCWGRNDSGQLGDGTTTDRDAPVQVKGLTGNVTALAASSRHTCAIADGSLHCWGSDLWGQLGSNALGDSFVPADVLSPKSD
jgi:alpha-tubulin suppressor-like RCC1 family protein